MMNWFLLASLVSIWLVLNRINNKLERLTLMTKVEAARLDKLTTDIKNRFEKLIAKIGDQITPEEQAEVDKDFATLESIGADPDNPVPTA